MSRTRAFTLLEVMVAIAILGLSLTVILSAQAGLYTSSTYAQRVGIATGLARCRMAEIEERLLKLGYPYADESDEGACCADDSRPDFRCKWKVQLVELPQPRLDSSLGGDAGAGVAAAIGSAQSATGSSGASTLSALVSLTTNPAAAIGDGGIGGLSSITSSLGAQGLSGTDAIAPLVMGFVYPSLKPLLEASIRKVTVTVTWKEGFRARDVEIVQYVTNPMKVAAAAGSGSASPFGGPPPTSGALPPLGGGSGAGGGTGIGAGAR